MFHTYANGAPASLQHKITHLIEKTTHEIMITELKEQKKHSDLGRMQGCAGKGAGTWLNVLPTSDERIIPDAEYRMCIRQRLGMFRVKALKHAADQPFVPYVPRHTHPRSLPLMC